jgi:hypothetical protein
MTNLGISNLKSNLPTNARQAKALIESASVRGVLIYNNCNKVMMPLLDLTQSQTLLMRSSEVFPVGFFYKKGVLISEDIFTAVIR